MRAKAKTTLSLITLLSFLVFPSFVLAQEDASEPQADSSSAQPLPEEVQAPTSLLREVNEFMLGVLFVDISGGSIQVEEVDGNGSVVLDEQGAPKQRTIPVPFLVAFLLFGSIGFTIYHRFINLRAFSHAINVVRGKFDDPEDEGEISHFRALTSALSATIGLGNIAGVAVAIQTGGPGAVFWMFFTAIFSMTAKFNSCTLAQVYRQVNTDGSMSGGPMYYLDIGLSSISKSLKPLGKLLALMYAVMAMGGALGAGNMFQANQATQSIVDTFALGEGARLGVGIVLALAVAAVILGGIKRIGAATSKIVPAMCGIYVVAAMYIILANISEVPHALGLIVGMAFSGNALFGGLVGVLVTGITRAVFSNEGGLGSAAIAHAAAKTDEPVREGLVAMIGPVIDTMLVCSMTALVIVITGVWENADLAAKSVDLDTTLKGVLLTSEAFGSVIPWFPYVLTVCIALFAYSTMIAWCYYGERAWIYVFDHFGGNGLKSVIVFRLTFVAVVVFGAVNRLGDILDFSDVMLLSMALPNILGSAILAPKVYAMLKDYMSRLKSGEMKPTS